MPIKCQSNQIITECYKYTLAAGVNTIFPVKARSGEVLIVHSISVYNNSVNNYTLLYKLMKHKGCIIRLNYAAALNAGVVQQWATDVYLIDGEEGGFALTPSAAGDTIEVNFQIIRMKDTEYFKST